MFEEPKVKALLIKIRVILATMVFIMCQPGEVAGHSRKRKKKIGCSAE